MSFKLSDVVSFYRAKMNAVKMFEDVGGYSYNGITNILNERKAP